MVLGGYLLWHLIIEPFQSDELSQTKVFVSLGNSYPAWQLNVQMSPTVLPWSIKHEAGDTLVPGASVSAPQVLARTRQT